MQAVPLQTAQIGGNAVEEKGIERNAIFGGKLGIIALELF
jgi:hypothetical protein